MSEAMSAGAPQGGAATPRPGDSNPSQRGAAGQGPAKSRPPQDGSRAGRRPAKSQLPQGGAKLNAQQVFGYLLLLLMGLFIALYGLAEQKRRALETELNALKAKSPADAKPKEDPPANPPAAAAESAALDGPNQGLVQEIRVGLDAFLKGLALDSRSEERNPSRWLEWEARDDGALVIRVVAPGLFSPGDARVSDRVRPLLLALGERISTSGRRIRIEGHADFEDAEWLQGHAEGAIRNTWELSAMRASAVAQLWMKRLEFDPAKMEIAGFGRYRELGAARATDGSRRNNKRIEVLILK